MKIFYLSLQQILVIHEDQIERYGGLSGLRKLELLESALFRPQSTFDGNDLYESVFEKTAALMHSLILNHPFVDGNKRTGIVAGIIFLEINGFRLEIEQSQIVEKALLIASKKLTIQQIAEWLKKNLAKK